MYKLRTFDMNCTIFMKYLFIQLRCKIFISSSIVHYSSISMIKYRIYNLWLILCTLNENSCLSFFFDCFCIVKKYNQDALQSNSMVNKIESCALFARLHRSNKKLTRPKSRVSRWLLKNSKMIDFVLLLFQILRYII